MRPGSWCVYTYVCVYAYAGGLGCRILPPTHPLPPSPPKPRGGLIFWADLVGAPKIVATLEALAAKFEPAGAGGFFTPCAYLRSAAAEGRKLSAGVVASRL